MSGCDGEVHCRCLECGVAAHQEINGAGDGKTDYQLRKQS